MSEGRSSSPATTIEDNASQQNHATPPPFNPLPSSHASPGVHSVVPDLMRVYESLTKTGGDQHQPHDSASPQQQQQGQEPQQYYQQQKPGQQPLQPPGQLHVPAPAQHVNYAFITSAEQYQQLYAQGQGGRGGDPNQMPPQLLPYQHNLSVAATGVDPMATSLPYIPAPYGATMNGAPAPQQHKSVAGADKSSGSDGSNGNTERSSSRASLRRKRSSASQQVEQDNSPPTSKSNKGRKKAKETDGRWSKRFTWPDELHRDFVSAVFDVGLKHSSPSTVLEHMPKHPQITSERIKSHLQKYRVHRVKSKQEFMSSYEASLRKCKASGGFHTAKKKTLSDGETAAHLSHSVLNDTADPSSSNAATSGAAACVGNKKHGGSVKLEPGAPQNTSSSIQGPAMGPLPGHEALMLPKLTESEKTSPIGASMGYLLGLFFSLKKQLLAQRAMEAKQPSTVISDPPALTAGPVAAAYNSFVGGAPQQNGGAGNPMQAPMTAPMVTAGSMDWSSSSNPPSNIPGGPGGDPSQPPAGVPNPVAVQTGSTRTNLEASSMMKREMQNQMAFQNKMRALKQQELNKYKNVTNEATNNPGGGGYRQQQQQQGHQEGPTIASAPQPHQQQQQYMDGHQESGGPLNTTTPEAEHHQGSHAPHPQDQHGGNAGGVEGGDGDAQGAGETAADARARVPSFSIGGHDDFWNADVMDEQLFEFLMDN